MKKKLSFLLLTVAALLVALAAGPVFGQGEDGLDRADKARQANTETLMAKPGVVGVALGFNPAGRASVKVYTEHSEVKNIPHELNGVPVHVVVTGKISALYPSTAPALAPTASHATGRFDRPVPIGVSTGHPDITAGTIGARVKDGNGNVYALSNNHVYADENQARIGDDVIQPGNYDGGGLPGDYIGDLSDFEPIVFSTSANNVIDAAIALSSMADLGNATPSDGYGTPSSTIVYPPDVLGKKVKKYGRTTGETSGRVDAINATLNIGYSSGTARFVNQIVIKPGKFSAGGDSGSLIVTKEGDNPVGLLYAGSQIVTIANPIAAVLDRFNVTIDDYSGPPPPPPPPPTTGSISGTVSDGNGPGIGGASVKADTGQSTTTAGDGTYMLSDVPTGERTVTALAAGYMSDDKPATVDENLTSTVHFSLLDAPAPPPPSDLSITVGTDQATYELGNTVRITGQVTGSAGPVAGATVTLIIDPPKGPNLRPVSPPVTDGNGNWSFNFGTGNRTGKGTYGAAATAEDDAGNTSNTASTTFEVIR